MITALVRRVNVKMTQIRPLKPEIEWGIYALEWKDLCSRMEGAIFSNIGSGGFMLKSSGGFMLSSGGFMLSSGGFILSSGGFMLVSGGFMLRKRIFLPKIACFCLKWAYLRRF